MTRETMPFVPPVDDLPPGIGADPFPGEFRLVRRLGCGSCGQVWLAEDLSPLGRLVALKFLRVSRDDRRHAQALEILQNEARLLGSVRHPHIVQVHAWRQAGLEETPCLVLQFVPGGSLEAAVERSGPLPWHIAGRHIADVAEGLLLLHRRGIIHRDVKPANILLDSATDEALLTDLGIAARLADPPTIAGTFRYMAPEAFTGNISPALDVYSLAATLSWLVSARPPFDGHTPSALVAAIRQGLPADDARFAGVPRELEQLLRTGLAADPGDRPTMETFTRELRGALNLLLADCLARPTGPVNLRLLVSRQIDRHHFVPVASSLRPADSLLRDRQRVPAVPAQVVLRTGDRVRVEVVADQPGHITVFNVGPTGNLNLLHPASPDQVPPRLPAGEVLRVLDVELTPPTGAERLFAVWTREPLPLDLHELHSLAGETTAYRATRDMARMRRSLEQLPPTDRHAVVLELDHQGGRT